MKRLRLEKALLTDGRTEGSQSSLSFFLSFLLSPNLSSSPLLYPPLLSSILLSSNPSLPATREPTESEKTAWRRRGEDAWRRAYIISYFLFSYSLFFPKASAGGFLLGYVA